MASSVVGVIGKSASQWIRVGERKIKNRVAGNGGVKVSCSYSSSVVDPYKTLRIRPDASESEVKKAFRQLALQVWFSGGLRLRSVFSGSFLCVIWLKVRNFATFD